MSEQPSSSPPPLPNVDEPPEITIKPNEWHYVDNGVKKGPVSATTIKSLLDKKEIETDIQVWRKGMIEWKSIRESDLGELVASEPPAILSQHIGNGYVWTLAFLPLIWGLIDASIAASNNPGKALPFQIPFVINALFGWLDEVRLRKAGYGSKWMRAAAVLLVPVYLFARAKRLKQKPWYAICWIITFLIGIFFVIAVNAGF